MVQGLLLVYMFGLPPLLRTSRGLPTPPLFSKAGFALITRRPLVHSLRTAPIGKFGHLLGLGGFEYPDIKKTQSTRRDPPFVAVLESAGVRPNKLRNSPATTIARIEIAESALWA